MSNPYFGIFLELKMAYLSEWFEGYGIALTYPRAGVLEIMMPCSET